jgi:hypothetical protein
VLAVCLLLLVLVLPVPLRLFMDMFWMFVPLVLSILSR